MFSVVEDLGVNLFRSENAKLKIWFRKKIYSVKLVFLCLISCGIDTEDCMILSSSYLLSESEF